MHLLRLRGKKEGCVQISKIFEETAANGKEHEDQYRKLLANVEGGLVFSRDGNMI